MWGKTSDGPQFSGLKEYDRNILLSSYLSDMGINK